MKKLIFLLLTVFALNASAQYTRTQVESVWADRIMPSVTNINNSWDAVWFKNDTVANHFYYEYTALLTQTSTSAPTATILFNSIGTIVWSRTGTGQYVGTLTGAFTANKTAIFFGGSVSDGYIILATRTSANTVLLFTVKASDGTATDAAMAGTPVTIKVYR